MASLLDSFSGMLTPQVIGPIAQTLGVDPNLMTQGLQLAGPLLTSGLAKAAGTPDGLNSLMNLMPSGSTDNIGNLVKSSLSTPDGQQGIGQVMDLAFGGGANTAMRTMDKALGFSASPLLAAATPMLMGLIKKNATANNLTSDGVATMLKSEADSYQAAGGPGADLINQTWANIDRLNALKARFTPQEMAAVSGAPLAVTGLVIGAAPSSGGDIAKEVGAAAAVIDEAETAAGGIALGDLLPRFSADNLKSYLGSTPKDSMLRTISTGVAAMEAKAPDAAGRYKNLLNQVGTQTANAAKEGGFLGFGGQQVSDAEASILAAIREAVG